MTEIMNEEFGVLYRSILIAIFLVFLVMAMQFESPRLSFMVMMCIPFSLVGSIFLLFIVGATISMVSLMGFLMLVGIVVNNGILYVDTVNQLKEEMPLEDALIDAGAIRLRPILMTTLTTILSMVPMGLGLGSNGAMMQGMAYLPENRKEEGIIADLSVRENIIIALQAKQGMFKLMSRKEQEEFTDKYIDILQIKTADRETPIKQLSGGNQQKVILGRWLLTQPDFLILDEPTRGIDIGTKTEIQKLVLKLAEDGMSVVFISSEIEEMLRTCSRMAVLRDGEKVGELAEGELSQDSIMKAIAGGGEE